MPLSPSLGSDISDLLVVWQRTREAIGSLENAQPMQLSRAMRELLDSRDAMESMIHGVMLRISSRQRED